MEENYNDELTFRKVWEHIKKSGVRIIVYAIVALIVCGGILGICDIFVSQSQYETGITFYYSGAELGAGPWGGQVDVVAEITSASNVSAALDKLQYTDEEKDSLVRLVIKNLSVTSDIDESVDGSGAVTNGTYSYKVILSRDSKIDKIIKSRNAYNNIVSAITSNYVENFKTEYSLGVEGLDNLVLSNSYNAFQKYDNIKGNVNKLLGNAKIGSDLAPTFVSTSAKISFGVLQNRIENVLLPKLEIYSEFVASNGIDANNEKEYVSKMLASATKNVEIYEKNIEECLQLISSLTNGGSATPSEGILVGSPADSKALNKALDDLNVAQSNRNTATIAKNFWERCQKDYESAQNFADRSSDEKTKLVNEANALVTDVVNEYNSLVDTYKAMVEEYNGGYSVSSIVRMTSAPTQETTSPITLKVGVVVEAVVFIIAVIVAMLVTSKKGAMVLKKKTQKQQAQEAVNQDAEVQDQEQAVDEVEDCDQTE